MVERIAETALPTALGRFRAVGFRSLRDGKHHMAMVKGDVAGATELLVRVHSECLTGDVFGSLRCDCGQQLQDALRRIEADGRGTLLYLAQEGRGIGLLDKLRAYQLQDHGFDTVEANLRLGLPADARDYGVAASILTDLGIRSIHLLTNNPAKVAGLTEHGVHVAAQLAIEQPCGEHNRAYLGAKRDRLGHLLRQPALPPAPRMPAPAAALGPAPALSPAYPT